MNIISKCKESVVDGSSPDFISTHPADWLTGPTDRWWKGHFGVSGSPEWSWRWNLQCAHCCRSSLLRRTHPPEGVWWHRGTRLTGRNTWNGDMRTSQITKGSGNNTDFRLRFDRYMDRHTVKMYSQTEAGRYTDIIEDQGTLISVWLLFSGCFFFFFYLLLLSRQFLFLLRHQWSDIDPQSMIDCETMYRLHSREIKMTEMQCGCKPDCLVSL